MIVLNIIGEEEARRFLSYVLLNSHDPGISYRTEEGLVVLMSMGQELMVALIKDEPAECRDAGYYTFRDPSKIECGKGVPSKDVLLSGPVLFVIESYAMIIADEEKEIEVRGNILESENNGSG